MARRDSRRFGLADGPVRRRGKETARLDRLDRLDRAVDWPAVETIVGGIYAGREGGRAPPLVTHLKLLLLQRWYGPSDEGPEAAVDDRPCFRRFAGLPLAAGVPDHGPIIRRFRGQLAERAAWPSGSRPGSTGSPMPGA